VHLTETCEDDAPNLITHVETTAAPMADGEVTPRVHRALQEQQLLPQVHIVDTGYLDAELLVTTKAEIWRATPWADATRSPLADARRGRFRRRALQH
jgi:hypothetical protein